MKLFSLNLSKGIYLLCYAFLAGIIFSFETTSSLGQSSLQAPPRIQNIAVDGEIPDRDFTEPSKKLWDYLPNIISRQWEDKRDRPKISPLAGEMKPGEELAVFLDGKTGYITVPNSFTLDFSKGTTLELWFKSNEAGTVQGIFEKYQENVGGFSLSITPQGNLQLRTSEPNTSSGQDRLRAGNALIANNEWNHIAVTFTGKGVSIFLNGRLDVQETLESGFVSNASELTFGRVKGINTKKDYFSGLMDEIRISNFVRYSDDFSPDRNLNCGGLFGLIAGCWRFNDQNLYDTSGNANHASIAGNVSFVPNSTELSGLEPVRKGIDKPFAPNNILIDFDKVGITEGTQLHNAYSGVSFYETSGYPMYASFHCTTSGNPCNGQSLPYLARALYGEQDVVFFFSQPATVSSFTILASDTSPGYLTNLVSFRQDGQYYTFGVVSNGQLAPITVQPSLATCGSSPCSRVTEIRIHNIVDYLGLGYDNLNYMTYAVPTPTPPECRSAGSNDNDLLPPCGDPSPTPTPGVPNAPTNLVAENVSGKVNLQWEWTSTTSNPAQVSIFQIERSNSSSGPWEIILQNGLPSQRSYDDNKYDLRIDQTRYYRVKAYNSIGASNPSNVANGAPLSACSKYPPYTAPLTPADGSPFGAFGWSGKYKFEHGFSVRDVLLNGRMMAKHMGVPSVLVSGLNTPNNSDALVDLDNPSPQSGFLSTIYGFSTYLSSSRTGQNGINLDAKYCISSPSGQERWDIDLLYRFEEEKVGDTCEPSSGLPCSRFFPYVSFEYVRDGTGPNEGQSSEITINQRLHFKENDDPSNVMALVQDCDDVENPFATLVGPNKCYESEFPVDFRGTKNPVDDEIPYIGHLLYLTGENPRGNQDNIHQTGIDKVSMPGIFNNTEFSPAGCPSCIHDHWRWTGHWLSNASWGAYALPGTFNGLPIVGKQFKETGHAQNFTIPGNFLSATANVCKFHPEEFDIPAGLLCAAPFGAGAPERIYTPLRNSASTSITDQGSDIVFWYNQSSFFTPILKDGKKIFSEVFHAHGGFFQPVRARNVEKNLSIEVNGAIPQPKTIVVGNYYKHPFFPFDNINAIVDVSNTGSLPSNYTKIVGSEYRISLPSSGPWQPLFPLIKIGSDVSGSHVLTYKVPDSTSLTAFNKMRILHYEKDDWETLWIDRTILSGPDTPNFQNKTIKARVSSIGKFVLATLDGARNLVAPTDLRIQGSVSPSSVSAGSNATYVFTVSNLGADIAKNVILLNTISTATSLVSAESTQGTCSDPHDAERPQHDLTSSNRVRCLMGDIASGASVTVTITVKVKMFGNGTETTPIEVSSWTDVQAQDPDSNPSDNSVRLSFSAVPSTDKPPIVSVTSPSENSIYVATTDVPVNIPITVNATDTDGSIQEVKVYDTGELIGVASQQGGSNFGATLSTSRYGYHLIKAVATDSGGRTSSSEARKVLVNSPHSINIVSPAQDQFAPNSSISIKTSSTLVGSRIQKIELFSNGELLGKLRGISNTGNLFSHEFLWQNVQKGRYEVVAILTDISGATTISAPKTVVVTNSPTVAITSPVDGRVFSSGSAIDLIAQVGDLDGFVNKIEFYASGALIDTKNENIASGSSSIRWVAPPDGVYSLVVVVTDDLGVQTSSAPINIGVNRPSPAIGELVWVDDVIPSGATSGGDDGWNWMNVNPGSLLGNVAHQSLLKTGLHEHYFENASYKLQVNADEKLSAWIFLDPDYPPAEIMLQWKDDQGWEHRAYWGQNLIEAGTDGTVSRKRIGDIPSGTGWKQLKVSAGDVGLTGKLVNGMKFTVHGGRVAWDRVGKILANAPTPGPDPDFVWIDDAPPPGALLEAVHDTWTDGTWINTNPSPQSGSLAHRHWDRDDSQPFRQHSFRNSPSTMSVQPGDTLFTYVYLYANSLYRPETLILQWYDDSGWGHRAYWGRDIQSIGYGMDDGGRGTRYWQYMGPIPQLGIWTKLEVPASYVGLEGKLVKGMSFSVYQENRNGRAVWDNSGKSGSAPTGPVRALSFTTPLYRFRCDRGYPFYVYDTNKDFYWGVTDCQQHAELSAFIYGYKAPGSVVLRSFKSNLTQHEKRLYGVGETYPGFTYEKDVGYVPSVLSNVVSWYQYSCNNTYYFTTYPAPPDTATPTDCTFLGGTAPVHSTGFVP